MQSVNTQMAKAGLPYELERASQLRFVFQTAGQHAVVAFTGFDNNFLVYAGFYDPEQAQEVADRVSSLLPCVIGTVVITDQLYTKE